MPGDTPMPFMSVKGDPATWARVGDTIRVTRLKPYGREFDYVVESVDPWGFAINRTDCRGKGNGEFYGEYPGDYAVVSRAAPKPVAPAPAPPASAGEVETARVTFYEAARAYVEAKVEGTPHGCTYLDLKRAHDSLLAAERADRKGGSDAR